MFSRNFVDTDGPEYALHIEPIIVKPDAQELGFAQLGGASTCKVLSILDVPPDERNRSINPTYNQRSVRAMLTSRIPSGGFSHDAPRCQG
ncbi:MULTISPECIES: hypothetical protein [Pseudomonadaceae]|uniref:Uncharacterized protein n=1 Tax=Halopseudomonas litoralis TaxID=797277 RepID=A0A1H1VXS8_9GAMM|nr:MULTISPECIES: hypothetical protein [Pseudomonadaceae]SDS89563.1 hypothetical protein SAMN05216198_3080 [Halopseudomonas litoralis]